MLLEKLPVKPQDNLIVKRVPAIYEQEVTPFMVTTPPYDVILYFVYSLEDMKAIIFETWEKKSLKPGGRLVFAYPKLASKKYSGIHRDTLFPFLGVEEATGYVPQIQLKFHQMRSLDEDFTLVSLKNLPLEKNKVGTSQKVGDYVSFKGEFLQKLREENPMAAEFYQDLTPGYQKDWLRYIYSAKQEKTQRERFMKTSRYLQQEIKSIHQLPKNQ